VTQNPVLPPIWKKRILLSPPTFEGEILRLQSAMWLFRESDWLSEPKRCSVLGLGETSIQKPFAARTENSTETLERQGLIAKSRRGRLCCASTQNSKTKGLQTMIVVFAVVPRKLRAYSPLALHAPGNLGNYIVRLNRDER
jgi:hypothetical protein